MEKINSEENPFEYYQERSDLLKAIYRIKEQEK